MDGQARNVDTYNQISVFVGVRFEERYFHVAGKTLNSFNAHKVSCPGFEVRKLQLPFSDVQLHVHKHADDVLLHFGPRLIGCGEVDRFEVDLSCRSRLLTPKLVIIRLVFVLRMFHTFSLVGSAEICKLVFDVTSFS